MDLDVELYSSRHIPVKSASHFVVHTLREIGWNKSSNEEVVLDVGCGSGGTTKQLILPLFQKVKKIFAIDVLPGMIASAKEANSSPDIDYSVADIENWSTIEHLENQITKLFSISCFQWLRDQREGFRNVSRVLKPGGEAAIFFVLQGGFFESILDIQKSPKWSHFLQGVRNFVPESQIHGYGVDYYTEMLDTLGFDVKYCKVEEKIDVFGSEEEHREFFLSICVLRNHVPEEQREEFENDFMEELFKKNGRETRGLPRHVGKMIELIIKKR